MNRSTILQSKFNSNMFKQVAPSESISSLTKNSKSEKRKFSCSIRKQVTSEKPENIELVHHR